MFGLACQRKLNEKQTRKKDAKHHTNTSGLSYYAFINSKFKKNLRILGKYMGHTDRANPARTARPNAKKYDQSLSEPEFFTWPVTNGDYASDPANHYGNYLADRKFFQHLVENRSATRNTRSTYHIEYRKENAGFWHFPKQHRYGHMLIFVTQGTRRSFL